MIQQYFAAANGRDGFVSYFPAVFRPGETGRTLIVKGGSGTGKSTLIKAAAETGEARGMICERFFCSADPASLDGILLYENGRPACAVIDGTAPHIWDPRYPGACEEIVNLGRFWDGGILRTQKDTIIALNEKKSVLYREAYALLGCAGVLLDAVHTLAREILLGDKMEAAAGRLLTQAMKEARLRPKEKPSLGIRALSALTTRGAVHFDTFAMLAARRVTVDDSAFGGLAAFFMDAVLHKAALLGLDAVRAPDPLHPGRTEAIWLPDLGLAILPGSREDAADGDKNVNMARFIDGSAIHGELRRQRRRLARAKGELIGAALEKLAQIRPLHGELEAVYADAMDFEALDAFTPSVIASLFA